ncbi:MAG: hypothetical protein U0835_22945 [Isosphaeraceae bacterium]
MRFEDAKVGLPDLVGPDRVGLVQLQPDVLRDPGEEDLETEPAPLRLHKAGIPEIDHLLGHAQQGDR